MSPSCPTPEGAAHGDVSDRLYQQFLLAAPDTGQAQVRGRPTTNSRCVDARDGYRRDRSCLECGGAVAVSHCTASPRLSHDGEAAHASIRCLTPADRNGQEGTLVLDLCLTQRSPNDHVDARGSWFYVPSPHNATLPIAEE